MAPLVRTGGSRHTGLAALPHRNIQVPSFHKIRKLVRALNVPPEPLFYPNNHTDNLDYQRLLMYLSKCNDEQITAILAIVEAYLRTYKIPTDHDKQDP